MNVNCTVHLEKTALHYSASLAIWNLVKHLEMMESRLYGFFSSDGKNIFFFSKRRSGWKGLFTLLQLMVTSNLITLDGKNRGETFISKKLVKRSRVFHSFFTLITHVDATHVITSECVRMYFLFFLPVFCSLSLSVSTRANNVSKFSRHVCKRLVCLRVLTSVAVLLSFVSLFFRSFRFWND